MYLHTLMYPTPPLIPTTTPTPPNIYHYPYNYPYSSPYLPPWAPPAFLEGWGQDRVRGRHLTAKYYYGGVVCFRPIQRGGGGGMAPPGGAHDLPLLLPLPTTTSILPWSEVTSMVTCVMMRNSLIHYCQSMKHIYMDTGHKLS